MRLTVRCGDRIVIQGVRLSMARVANTFYVTTSVVAARSAREISTF
jgi:hypothetical protein